MCVVRASWPVAALLLVALAAADVNDAPTPTPKHTVSGLSAGASAALIHTVAFSTVVDGAAIVAGSPYGCQILKNADDVCGQEIQHPAAYYDWDTYVPKLKGYIEARAQQGLIDPLSNLGGKRIYLYSGQNDTVVKHEVMLQVAAQFQSLSANVQAKFDIAGEHGWIVDDYTCSHPGRRSAKGEPYCGPKMNPPNGVLTAECCGTCKAGISNKQPWWQPPINNCGYDMSGAVFRFLMNKTLQPRTRGNRSHLLKFNQTQFLPPGVNATEALLDKTGFVYVPAGCKGPDGNFNSDVCTIHVHYHCCYGSVRQQGINLILRQGLLEWAEPNNIVIIFPQAGAPQFGDCWDWWGGTNKEFDTHSGLQIATTVRMVRGISQLVREGVAASEEGGVLGRA
jgi:poly(3-hydroxybutyrate) depolymerase